MSNWKDLLKTASIQQCLDRARAGMGANTVYILGKGGFDPTKPLTNECDCSGFIAWSIGIPREFPPGSGRWLDTDAYWNGGGSAAKAAGFPLCHAVPAAEAEPGDLIVYPDQGGHQGHIGVVSSVDDQGQLKVIHCSKGNFTSHHDATRETDAHVWNIQPKTKMVRIDFDAMRRYAGVDGEPVVIDSVDPAAGDSLHHSLLATDPTLQLVIAGKLHLSRTGTTVSGIAPVQQAMKILGRKRPTYVIDLGVNQTQSGIFGLKTENALKALQADLNLPQTGSLDAATLKGLDDLMMKDSAEVPVEDHDVDIESSSSSTIPATGGAPLVFDFSHEGNAWFATVAGERFYVGNRVPYEGRIGLQNEKLGSGMVYEPERYAGDIDYWAYFINPTALAESKGSFHCLNTYDSAGFTFGFLQFAAHVAEGDFVKFFRALLQLDESAAYFPDLGVENGHIVRRTPNGVLRLEKSTSSEALKRYLNPSGSGVEDAELLSSARFIHWAHHSQAHRDQQVKTGVETIRQKLRDAQQRMNLNGRSDKVCFVVMDILHQGRGTYAVMKQIVENNNDSAAYTKLLTIGASNYAERIQTIRGEVARLEGEGRFGVRKYRAATNDFA
jgi:hypothetical protein